jgi:hypothetical protein
MISELHIDNSADHLCDFAFCVCHVLSPVFRALLRPR